jgi:hypothetical protein
MKLRIKGVIIDSNKGEKNTYVSIADIETGGMIKLAFDGLQDFAPGKTVGFDATVKPGLGKNGLYLVVKDMQPVKE